MRFFASTTSGSNFFDLPGIREADHRVAVARPLRPRLRQQDLHAAHHDAHDDLDQLRMFHEEDDVIKFMHLVVNFLQSMGNSIDVLLVDLRALLRRHRQRHSSVALAVVGDDGRRARLLHHLLGLEAHLLAVGGRAAAVAAATSRGAVAASSS